ncbi:recombination regulator RecX [Endozoicomonas sp. Mp262]|uniref:regulatory protein RecX n=1 Tax=Endozoicomonas sp. Mp262 TaxID=2919499 RepID=UPI0021D8BF9F
MSIITPDTLRRSAMNLLARREYSRGELVQKLNRLTDDKEMIAEVLDRLEGQTLLSDDRFVESFIRSHVNRGHGPMRINQELRQKGIAADKISLALESLDIDWFAKAEEARQKKFSSEPPEDMKEKARQIRFLQYRGFPAGVVMELF